MKHSPKNCKNKSFSSYTRIHYKLTLIPIHYKALNLLMWRFGPNDAASCVIIDILFFHCSFVDMLNIISTCRDILCVDLNVDKRCVDHSTSKNTQWWQQAWAAFNMFVCAQINMTLLIVIFIFYQFTSQFTSYTVNIWKKKTKKKTKTKQKNKTKTKTKQKTKRNKQKEKKKR